MAQDTVPSTTGDDAVPPGSDDGRPPTPEVDVPALTALLDGRYAQVRDLVRRNLAAHASVLEEAETLPREDYRDRVRDLVVEMAATGQTGMGFPEEYGGGGDIGASVAAFETLAFGDLSVLVKVGVQFGLFGGAILQLGTKQHHDAYLPELVTGQLMGCFAMTEAGHGSNVQALGTVAAYDVRSGEFVITTPVTKRGDEARKDYIGNAARHARLAVVFAQLETGPADDRERQGVHAFVVPIRDEDGAPMPGVRIEDDGLKLGLNGVDNGRLWFDAVRVPRDALLNRFADVGADGGYESPIDNPNRRFFTMLGTLVQGRVCVGGAGINAAKVALAIAVRYAVRRRQFEAQAEDEEQLLLDYGMHQRRLLPLLARTYALHFAQEVVASRLHDVFSGQFSGEADDEKTRRELESRAAGTKALGTWHATETIQECREACGGAGYLAVNRFAALKADTDVFTTFEGDNHVLLQLVAKGLLTDYASEFEEVDQLGMVRFVTGMAVEAVIERTSVHKLLERLKDVLPGGDKWDDEAGILDTDYHLAMLRFREEHQLAGVARRLKRGTDAGMNPGLVFSRVQDHVIAAARSHVERLVLEAFVDKLASLEDSENKRALALLCDLHALSVIEADRAWFMEHGRLTVVRSKAISRETTGSAAGSAHSPSISSTRSAYLRPCSEQPTWWARDPGPGCLHRSLGAGRRPGRHRDRAPGQGVPARGSRARLCRLRVPRRRLARPGRVVGSAGARRREHDRLGVRSAGRGYRGSRGAGDGGRQVLGHLRGPAGRRAGVRGDLAHPAPHCPRSGRRDPRQPGPPAARQRQRGLALGRRRSRRPSHLGVRRTPARWPRPRPGRPRRPGPLRRGAGRDHPRDGAVSGCLTIAGRRFVAVPHALASLLRRQTAGTPGRPGIPTGGPVLSARARPSRRRGSRRRSRGPRPPTA